MESGRDHAVLAFCSGLYFSVYVHVFYLPINLDQALLDRFFNLLIKSSLRLLKG